MPKPKKNRLAKCTSPYLQQHAENPVDWYPWGEEALQQARKRGKPILLSIGYSACHWCHVMAHESFADAETAALMNKHFINIKVDREERPDLDKIYQLTFQLLLGRSGGWPLTMFLTPEDGIPFFGGTYFPLESQHGMPAFKGVLRHIAEFFHAHQDAIKIQNSQLMKALQQTQTVEYNPQQTQFNNAPIDNALKQLAADFDPVNGGFTSAPKFPMPLIIEFLLQQAAHHDQVLSMALTTLNKMAQGGIYDQLGGGFFRYSVDAQWMIPHFEKMLYDNALLLEVFVHAYLITKNVNYKNIAVATAQWVMREMQSAEGGYFATLDADSEGKEGKFYYWDLEQVQGLLKKDEYEILSQVYGLNQPANFEGHWHLHTLQNVENKAKQLLESAKQKLFKAREKRVRPHRDEKIITSWNGLMIKAMTIAGQHLDHPEFIKSAQNAHTFIYKNLWKNPRLHAAYKDGKISETGFLDDYAFMLDATLNLLQLENQKINLNFATDLAQGLMKHYQDETHGGFYFTANDHEQLILRPKSFMDEAIPSGNGIAALALLKLGHLSNEPIYRKAGEETLKSAWLSMNRAPSAHMSLLLALQKFLSN